MVVESDAHTGRRVAFRVRVVDAGGRGRRRREQASTNTGAKGRRGTEERKEGSAEGRKEGREEGRKRGRKASRQDGGKEARE